MGTGGGGVGMKHKGPMGLFKPKTKLLRLNNFQYLFQSQYFQSLIYPKNALFEDINFMGRVVREGQ
jgi:hypothetical protein